MLRALFFMLLIGSSLALRALPKATSRFLRPMSAKKSIEELPKNPEGWKTILNPNQFAVLRMKGR
jgi:hypothetical protein